MRPFLKNPFSKHDPVRITIRVLLVLLGAFIAWRSAPLIVGDAVNQAYIVLLGGLVTSLFTGRLSLWLRNVISSTADAWVNLPPQTVLAATIATILALIISVLLNNVLSSVPGYAWYYQVGVTLGLEVFLVSIAVMNRDALVGLSRGNNASQTNTSATVKSPGLIKLLDTNVIIDGRVLELARAGFLEGSLIIPGFVLRELQYFADSSDKDKRNKGRRGLDLLEKLRQLQYVDLTVREFEDTGGGVDDRLIRAALEINGAILTNDTGLARVASIQDVRTLSLNGLADALKPRLGSGDELNVQIIKEGSQPGQGVAYLEDGTMVVVEDGLVFKGRHVIAVVQTVTQTSLGRMVFAKAKEIAS